MAVGFGKGNWAHWLAGRGAIPLLTSRSRLRHGLPRTERGLDPATPSRRVKWPDKKPQEATLSLGGRSWILRGERGWPFQIPYHSGLPLRGLE